MRAFLFVFVLVVVGIGLLAGGADWVLNGLHIPAWVWWVGGVVGMVAVAGAVAVRPESDAESDYHMQQQALCERRKQIVSEQMRYGPPQNLSGTALEQYWRLDAEYKRLKAQSEELMKQ